MTDRPIEEYLTSQDAWDEALFDEAVRGGYFTTYNAALRERKEHATFEEALREIYLAKHPARYLLYAVANSERFTLVPPNTWNKCARRYLELTR